MALQHLLNATVEPLDHPVGLGRLWRGQSVFDAQGSAEFVKLVLTCRDAFAQAEEPIGELLSITPSE